jgi:hypothetical protein
MADGAIDKKRIETAVRRLQVLPDRKTEIGRAVAGLLIVIETATRKEGEAPPAPPPEPEPEPEEPIDIGRLAAAKELREAQWLFQDLKEAWDNLSAEARDALSAHVRAATPKAEPDEVIDRLAALADAMAAVADALEQPDPPAPVAEPETAPAPAPKPDDATLIIAQHAARMYTRLTGKRLPKKKGKDGIPRGPFFWLLEDVFAGAGILASAAHYAEIVAKS